MTDLHNILERQLRRLKVNPNKVPGSDEWEKFLEQVDRAYRQADQDRYLLERSLAISSKEMQELYDEEKRQAQKALKVSEGKYRSLFDNANDSIFLIDVESRAIIDANHIAATRLGYSVDELLKLTIDQLNPPSEAKQNLSILDEIQRRGKLTFERTHIRKDGSLIPVEISSSYIDVDGKRILQSTVRDITERKIAEQKLKHLATHDTLTKLKNRAMFDDRLAHAIQLAKRKQEKLAVMFLDLDNFKEVNDAFGHKPGDELIRDISLRLEANVRESDTVARFGGDEFVILLEGIANENDVLNITHKIMDVLAKPFLVGNAEVFITPSIGISIFPKDGKNAENLVQNADRAMYLSKRTGKNTFEFFNASMKTKALEKLELSNNLRKAVETENFELCYQPQVNARNGKVIGVEALIRWDNGAGTLLRPKEFLPIAEETGLILPIGEWVLERACKQMNLWETRGIAPDRISINLSEREINRPDLIRLLQGILTKNEIAPHKLELELTENIIFRDMDKSQKTLGAVKDLGIRLAIDDFGTGYSTLQHLAHFPFDTLKIDQHFASDINHSSNDAAIVRGIVMIAQNLGVNVIAEGIENEAQLQFFEAINCHNIQGWIFSKGVAAEEIEDILINGIARPQLELDLGQDSRIQSK